MTELVPDGTDTARLPWLSTLPSVSHVRISTNSTSQDVVEHFVQFCERQGVNMNEYDSALKLCVMLSLAGVDVRKLCSTIIPDVFVDWVQISGVSDNGTSGLRVFGENPAVWIRVMQFFSLKDNLQDETQSVAAGRAVLTGDPVPEVLLTFGTMLKEADINLPFAHIARLFVLSSVNKQPMLKTVTQYCRIIYKNNVSNVSTQAQAQLFLGKYVDNRVKFESEHCYHGMQWVLRNFQVCDEFKNEVRYYHDHRDTVNNRMKLRAMQVHSGRPRLRDRLVSLEQGQRRLTLTTSAATQEAQDSFNGWCSRVRFPNNVCNWLRQKLYFLRCQHFNVDDVVGDMVSHDVAKKVCECTISVPETAVIDAVITRMLFHRQPFREMLDFRAEAFAGFALSHRKGITYPQIMQLYTAAYQKKATWKQHWQNVLPVMNHTVIMHVEKFVQTHPINVQAIIDTLNES